MSETKVVPLSKTTTIQEPFFLNPLYFHEKEKRRSSTPIRRKLVVLYTIMARDRKYVWIRTDTGQHMAQYT